MGDFNAKIGEGKDKDSGIGPHGLGIRNERGDMLANFCGANEHIIMNTMFKHHNRRKYTWKSPGDNYRNQIYFITINRK